MGGQGRGDPCLAALSRGQHQLSPSPPDRFVVDRVLLRKAAVGLVIVLAVAGATGLLFEEPLTEAGTWFINRFGLVGLCLGVVFTDASPLPLTNEPLVFLARGAGVAGWTIFWLVSLSSVVAGFVGYAGGRLAGMVLPMEAWMERRQPALIHYMRRYGAEGVAIAALLPIPFALSTWSAGILRVPLLRVAAACLVRIPKTAVFVGLILGGMSLGDG